MDSERGVDARIYKPEDLIFDRFLRDQGVGEVASRNERAILRQVWRKPGLQRSDLIGGVGLTQQSIHRIVEQLGSRHLITLGPPVPGTGRGKPSPTIWLNPEWGLSAGISLETDSAGVTVMDVAGRNRTRRIDLEGAGRLAGLRLMDRALDEILAEFDATRDALLGIGFGITGFRIGGTRFNPPVPLQDWALIDLGPLLYEHFGVPVWVENGANCSALAESTLGIGRRVGNFAYLSFNYGFGGAVISEGTLLRGFRGNAGEFSAIFDIEDNKRRPALGILLKQLRAQGVEINTITELRQSFDPSWPGIETWIEEALPCFNRVVNALSAIVDPEVIVLGGQIPRVLAETFVARTEFWSNPRFGVTREVPRLEISELDDEPSSIGSSTLPIASCLL